MKEPEVFLLWQNDAVLDVFATAQLAEDAATKVRADNPCERGAWRGKSPRWYQSEGRIARLEIDRRTVAHEGGV